MVPVRLIFAHLRSNPLRFLLTSGSVALALFLYCTLQTVLTTLDRTAGTSSSRLVTSSAVSLFQNLPLAGIEKIHAARIEGIRDIGCRTWFGGTFRDPKEFFTRFAIDVPAFRRQYGDRAPGGAEYLLSTEEWDKFEREKAACIIGRGLADRYGLRVGDPMVLEGSIYPGTYRFTIAAVYASENPTYNEETMFFHWSYLNDALERLDSVSTYTLSLDDGHGAGDGAGSGAGVDSAAICAAVDDLFRNSPSRTLTQPEAAYQAQFLQMWGNIGLLFDFIGMAVIFATCMISLNTMLLAVNERVREIGVLKTLGFKSSTLRGLYLLEALVVCGGGAAAGIGLARLLWRGQPIRLAMVTFAEFRVADDTLLHALAIGGALALCAGLAPALVASRLTIVRALRQGG